MKYFITFFLFFTTFTFSQEFEISPVKNKTDVAEIPDFGFGNVDSLENFPANELSGKRQRWSVLFSLLFHDAPMSQFITDTEYRSQWHKPWYINSQSSMGFAFGGGYDILFATYYVFRVQGEIETTGWISGIIDLGLGVRLPSAKTNNFNVQLYFSIMQTGDVLHYRGADTTLPNEIHLYIAFFGIKIKVSYDIEIENSYFLSPYISYAAYPSLVYNTSSHQLDRSKTGNILDSLQIGVEFGQKF